MSEKLDPQEMASTIARLSSHCTRLEERVRKLEGIIINVKSNMDLRTCLKCGNLHMRGHICYQCGRDPSDL